jgi:hypothetical protein
MSETAATADPPPPGAAQVLPNGHEERIFLEGPETRSTEFFRLLRILREFIRGFRALHFVGPCVTVFGSARFQEDHPYYEQAREVGRGLGRMGFTVLTGGGPGIMEAANRGARDVRARSIGCNIVLPQEQKPNPYVDRWLQFRYFFVRKVMLVKYSYAFIVMPGGFGTTDELFEALTLIQTRKILHFPVVLMGREYWRNLLELLENMIAERTIDEADLRLVLITDSVTEAMDHIEKQAVSQFGLQRRKAPRRSRWLGE